MVQAALSNEAPGLIVQTDAESELLAAVAGVLGGYQFLSSGVTGHYSSATGGK
jgi:DNA-binding NarL/FixJ family response regulator